MSSVYKENDTEKAKKTISTLQSKRLIHKNLVHKHHGNVIQETSELKMTEFKLASDAIRCAADLHRKFINSDITIKTGIHRGDINLIGHQPDGEDIEIAQRLSDMAKPDCIAISEPVYRELMSKKGFTAAPCDDKTINRSGQSIKVYRVKCYDTDEFRESINRRINSWQKHKIPYIVIAIMILILFLVFLWSWLGMPFFNS